MSDLIWKTLENIFSQFYLTALIYVSNINKNNEVEVCERINVQSNDMQGVVEAMSKNLIFGLGFL